MKMNREKGKHNDIISLKASGLVRKAKFKFSTGKISKPIFLVKKHHTPYDLLGPSTEIISELASTSNTNDKLLNKKFVATPGPSAPYSERTRSKLKTNPKNHARERKARLKRGQGKHPTNNHLVKPGLHKYKRRRAAIKTNLSPSSASKKILLETAASSPNTTPTSENEGEEYGDHHETGESMPPRANRKVYFKFWRRASLAADGSEPPTSVGTQTCPLGVGLYWPVVPLVRLYEDKVGPTAKGKVGGNRKSGGPKRSSNKSGTVPTVWDVIFRRMTRHDHENLPQGPSLRLLLTCSRVCKEWYALIMKRSTHGYVSPWDDLSIRDLTVDRKKTLGPSLLLFLCKRQPARLDLSHVNPSYHVLLYLLRWLPSLKHLTLTGASARNVVAPVFLNLHPPPLWIEALDLAWTSGLDGQTLSDLVGARGSVCQRPGFASGAQKYVNPNWGKDVSSGHYLPFKNLRVLNLAGTDIFCPVPKDLTLPKPCKALPIVGNGEDQRCLTVGYSIYNSIPNLVTLDVSYCQTLSPFFFMGLSGRIEPQGNFKKHSEIEHLTLVGTLVPNLSSDHHDYVELCGKYLSKKYFPNLKLITIGTSSKIMVGLREKVDKNIEIE